MSSPDEEQHDHCFDDNNLLSEGRPAAASKQAASPGSLHAGETSFSAAHEDAAGAHSPLKEPMDSSNGPEHGLQVRCASCGAVFMAYYGTNENDVEIVEPQSCGMCHAEPDGRMNFDAARVRMVARLFGRVR